MTGMSLGLDRTRPRGFQEGLTMIEVLVGLSLAAAVGLGAAAVAGTAARRAIIHEARLDAQQGARRALDRISEELRWAEAILADPACGDSGLCATRVRARIPASSPYGQGQAYAVTFLHNPVQREAERRVERGVNNLASLIDSLEFSYLDAGGATTLEPVRIVRLEINLVASPRDGPPVVLRTGVALRNRPRP